MPVMSDSDDQFSFLCRLSEIVSLIACQILHGFALKTPSIISHFTLFPFLFLPNLYCDFRHITEGEKEIAS